MRIGLTLSGGGFRATIFHLGVLARLALENRLEEVSVISTVSGGSLCAALVYAQAQAHWPSSRQFVEHVLPAARELLLTQDLELGLTWRALRSPLKLLEPRANYLSELLQRQWGFTTHLCDVPASPRWLINATCYETGKNWRFECSRLGDYVFGYSNDTDLPAADAVAASAGFPGLIGALVLPTRGRHWYHYLEPQAGTDRPETAQALAQPTKAITPAFPFVHLWDGGVYDNFGMEAVFDIGAGWRQDIEFLVVSDAAGVLEQKAYQPGFNAMLRIADVMMDQIRSVRTRALLEQIINRKEPGVLLRNSGSCARILPGLGDPVKAAELVAQCQEAGVESLAAAYPTDIRRPTPNEFALLFRHGYEMANCTLHVYGADHSAFMPYRDSPWGMWTTESNGN